ncbi:MAG: M28 family peptidase [Candidatus Kryptoniota bacterium]
MRNIILLFVLAIMFNSCSKHSETSKTRTMKYPDIPVPSFSGSNAFQYLVAQTNFGPRNPNSIGHTQCLAYLQEELARYADSVQLQSFDVTGYNGLILHLTNVIAHFNSKSQRRVLLSAHWDTRPRADHEKGGPVDKPILGANDGASGVAVLLEIARNLKSNPPPVGVDIILWDGEDYGREGDLNNYFLGSRYWAATKPYSYQPLFAVNLDMVGDKQLTLPKEGFSVKYAPDIVNLVWNTAGELGISQFIDRVGDDVYDDHLELDNVGIKAIDIIDFAYPDATNRYWHTLEDTPDKCSPESLAAVGRVLLQVIYRKVATQSQ